jgi:predicted membrane channel-forming protein YqfA (hemolysin III family)
VCVCVCTCHAIGRLTPTAGVFSVQAHLFLYKLLATFGSYMVGFFFYATQFPEKRWPGRFDLLGSSHQIWHVFVFIGAFLFYVAVREPLDPALRPHARARTQLCTNDM